MATSRALISSITANTDYSFRADDIKLCVLWYDEL
jgi:hypothetical protein